MSGKTTLFSAVVETGGSSVDLSRPDLPHSAMVKVPDDRLEYLAEIYKPRKKTLAELEIVDVPGLDFSCEAGKNRSRTSWSSMRQCDMLAFVVRSFDDSTVPAYRNRVDPLADVTEIRDEMILADLEQVTTRAEKLEVSVKKPTPDRYNQARELEIMKCLRETLENGNPVSSAIHSPMEEKIIRSFAFLTLKPAVVVLNCDENGMTSREQDEMESMPVLRLSAKIEQEIAQLPAEERKEFLSEMGLKEPATRRFVGACHNRAHLISFLTTVENECRAWCIPSGTTAVNAAEVIHSDIARGFIRAEVVSYDDLVASDGEMKKARAAGEVRLEGKDYVVKDGDVINFRFNV